MAAGLVFQAMSNTSAFYSLDLTLMFNSTVSFSMPAIMAWAGEAICKSMVPANLSPPPLSFAPDQ